MAKQIKDLSIKCSDGDQLTSQLSGGNKQKVVFGKWIGCGSEILILDCPTRGVDIGVKQSMYQLMMELKKEGKAILLISEELPELLGMSDRLLIMKTGAQSDRSMTGDRSEQKRRLLVYLTETDIRSVACIRIEIFRKTTQMLHQIIAVYSQMYIVLR